jgi:hypothetical protein
VSDPRPNDLYGQVQPNTLSEPGRTPVANAPGSSAGWQTPRPSPGPAPTPGVARTSAPSSASTARTVRRPFSLWTLIVIGFIVINLIRGFLAAGGGAAPVATDQPVATTAARSSIDPNVTPGAIDFGTAANDDCTVVGARTVFAPGTRIWWYAHLGTVLPGSARIVTKLTYGGSVLESLTGPDQSSFGGWDTLCTGEPIRYFGIGTYRLEVWDSSEQVLLAAGEYELVAETPPPS